MAEFYKFFVFRIKFNLFVNNYIVFLFFCQVFYVCIHFIKDLLCTVFYMFFPFLSIIVNYFFIFSAVNSRLSHILYIVVLQLYLVFYKIILRHPQFKTYCFFFASQRRNNSFCTFKSSLFLPLAALTFSAVNSRLLTLYTYFKFSLIVKQKRVENLLFFILAPQARLELATSRLTAVRSTN